VRDLIDRGLNWWGLFKEREPGARFQEKFRRRQQRRERDGSPRYGRVFNLVGGLGLIAMGFVLAWVIAGVGLILLAGESLALARLLDRGEVLLRRLAATAKTTWKSLPRALKVPAVLACLMLLAYITYGLASWWFTR
jgi:hypothetical protein